MANKNRLVTIIMPAYNAEKFIFRAIQSVIKQTYTHWELLIADDASNDSTRFIIDSFDDFRIKRFHQVANLGYLLTWNNLIEKAAGDYITFLDADDYMHNERVDILTNFLRNNITISIVGSSIDIINKSGESARTINYPLDDCQIKKNLYQPYSFPFCGSAVMIRRNVMEVVGIYRKFFNRVGWEDHDWLIRSCEKFKAANINITLYYYQSNPISVTRKFDYSHLSIRKLVIKKIGLEIALKARNQNINLLAPENFDELQNIIEKYEKPFKNDSSKLVRILSVQSLQNGQVLKALKFSFMAIGQKPLKIQNYLSLMSLIKNIPYKLYSGN